MRARLARQRPAPAHARGRERVEPPQRSWWHRVDWTKAAAIVGIGLGIGTLAFTGVATYYQARVAADQLAQSREKAEEDAKSQAARVALWVEDGASPESEVRVMNRSADPVMNVTVGVSFSHEVPTTADVRYDPVNYRVGRSMEFRDDIEWRAEARAVLFTDAKGSGWSRTPGKLVPLGSKEGLELSEALYGRDINVLTPKRALKAVSAGRCDSNAP